MDNLRVFSAGVAGKLAKMTASRFEAAHPGVSCEVIVGGSTDGVRRLIAGESFDVMILADSSNIEQMMMPEYTDGYFIWGGNEMVVMGEGITSENWKEKLLSPSAKLRHTDPYGDPSGYRAVMAMKLADRVEPGLSDKLLNHPNYNGLDREQYNGFRPPACGEGEYCMIYRSGAAASGKSFASLPPEMNLGDPAFEDVYNTVDFAVSENETVRGTTILHAITIPKAAKNSEGAVSFSELFLANRFPMLGFTPVHKSVGKWDIKPANMWDAEAHYYSLMTLLEITGTNMQLDCVPLDSDDIVLDCGCGPGRVAIQAAKRVKKVICLDNSEGMLAECRKNCEAAGVTNVEYILADWQETEIGKTIPEVDVVIQSRGGGGASTLNQLKKAARKCAVNIMWSDGAPCLPESRSKLFIDCYSEESLREHPELRPFSRPSGPPPGMPRPPAGFGQPDEMTADSRLPMASKPLGAALRKLGIEAHTTTVAFGWDRWFATKDEAYDWLIRLSRHPELVIIDRFRANVDSFLTEKDGGWYFLLPTSSDVTWFKTR
ncbi:MAG: substrate-binding domain-containing protein [Oscillospiraceae bacterium]|nr:substrate-binding domain-containing protein [Oscillospiraceae bacterium]